MSGPADTETVGMETPGGALDSVASGTVVGERYEILRPLGTGGSAIVYAAHDRTLKRDIALKVLRADKVSGPALTRFRREVRVARDVQSPYLVPIYDIGESESTAWISMELLEGGSLRSLVDGSPPPVERVVEIAEQLLEALDALHARGIVHRDVKPGNVMMDGVGRIKLTDMGLARRWDSLETRATATDHLVGTLEYLSPEQALGLELDGRSDLYSLGTMLYELLTGRLPFEAFSSLGTVVAHVHTPPTDVRKHRKDVPAWLAILVARLLAKKREERYQSAAEVLRDLRARRADWRFALRRARTKIVAGVVLLLFAVTGAVAWKAWNGSRFDRLVAKGGMSTAALDRAGRELWVQDSRTREAMVVAKLERWEPPCVVMDAAPSAPPAPDTDHALAILDAQSGDTIRTVAFPTIAGRFGGFSNRFSLLQLRAVDLNHDGLDEILACFAHTSYWPTYAVYYDPSEEVARPVLLASGHTRVVGTADFDRDGIDELVLFGINNRMGAYNALGVVKVKGFDLGMAPPPASGEWPPSASTPDADYSVSNVDALLWYALLPSPVRQLGAVVIDEERRVVTVRSPDDHVVTLGFDGFPVDATSTLSPDKRHEARRGAYRAARAAIRKMEAGLYDDSSNELGEAARLADLANDAMLREWVDRIRIRLLIRSKQFDTAEEHLDLLIENATNPGDVAFDAALEYHLGGLPRKAAGLFIHGLNQNETVDRGRKKYEYVEGALMALSELEQWREADRLVRNFEVAFPETINNFAGHYRTYIEWRSTGRVTALPDMKGEGADLQRYWRLEWAALGRVDSALLAQIDEELVDASEGRSLVLALQAEVLNRLGQNDKADTVIRQAWREASVERVRDPVVRGHLEIVRERYERITGEKVPQP